MKTISFLRHAKSEWALSLISDHDRCLADRGRKSSKAMKGYFLKSKQKFDYVCSSTALRAAETIEIIKPALRNVDIMFDKALYTFDDEILIDIISKISDDHSSVLLVGHNPAIQETILRLSSSKSDNKSLEKIQNKYPTAAFCKLYSDISSWAHVGDTLFELVDFICPRDL